jgi:hypothetical protein
MMLYVSLFTNCTLLLPPQAALPPLPAAAAALPLLLPPLAALPLACHMCRTWQERSPGGGRGQLFYLKIVIIIITIIKVIQFIVQRDKVQGR